MLRRVYLYFGGEKINLGGIIINFWGVYLYFGGEKINLGGIILSFRGKRISFGGVFLSFWGIIMRKNAEKMEKMGRTPPLAGKEGERSEGLLRRGVAVI